MKVAITITDITGNGGTERTSILLANTFLEHGHEVTIISLFKRNSSIYFPIKPDIKVAYLCQRSYTLGKSKLERLKLLLSARLLLKRTIRHYKFDEIISQAFLPTFLFHTICSTKRITACEHFKYELYGGIGTLIRNHIYKRCKRVVTLTENDSNKFKAHGIPNSVIPNMVSFPIEENKGQDKKTIVAAGRLSKQKGFDLLIMAMQPVVRKYPEWNLNIYGGGECEMALKQMVVNLNLDKNIHFKGFNSDISQVFRKSSFFVLSSRFEGFPMILLEAASQNLPCVSFDCPEGPSEILRDGGGLLVEAENVSELSKAIIKFIENDELRKNCAKQAIKNIELYSPQNIYRKWISTFKNE